MLASADLRCSRRVKVEGGEVGRGRKEGGGEGRRKEGRVEGMRKKVG